MIRLIEFIVVPIYHFFAKWRLARIVKRYGYRLTNIEWLPYSENPKRILRITPTDDGFEHTGDDCLCNPVRTTRNEEDGEYTLIQHREMNVV